MKLKYYAFYIDSFDWGITTDENYDGCGEPYLWVECKTFAEAKRELGSFFKGRIEENQYMRKAAKRITKEMVGHKRTDDETL